MVIKVYHIDQKGKIHNLRMVILKTISDLLMQDILDFLTSLYTDKNNCTKCIHWNYGRAYWNCLEDHPILFNSENIIEPSHHIQEIMIPFMNTYANNGCPDWKDGYNTRREYDKMGLKGR